LFGESGASWSVVYVDIDAHNRNRSIFETLLPRESATKECDVALMPSISFPAFATHDEPLYKATKKNILDNLQGGWGFRRFCRDGFGCVLEPEDETFYPNGITNQFENVESEWPLFHSFMIIDGVFKSDDEQVETHQRLLKQLIRYTDKGGNFFFLTIHHCFCNPR
jgi:phosphorylase kinase alpha/beta subunit